MRHHASLGTANIERQRRGAMLAWGNAPGINRRNKIRAESPFHCMPQSLDNMVLHLVFSTKDRFPCLGASVRPALHAYLATVVRNLGCECPGVGGVADHVHLAIQFSRTLTVAALVEEMKTASSKWLKTQAPELGGFAWQRGYGVFSVGPADLDALLAYIANQEKHHQTRTFQDEYRTFLTKYRVTFDERYVWD